MECPKCGFHAEDHDAFCAKCGHYISPLQDPGRPISTVEITEDGTSRTPPVAFPTPAAQPEKKVAQRIYPAPEYTAPQAQAPVQQPVPPSPPRPQPAPQPVYQEPVREEPVYDAPVYEDYAMPEPSISREDQKRLGRFKTMAVCFGVLALVATAVAVFVLVNTSSLRVQLNKAQRENASATSSTTQLKQQLDSLTKDLETAKQEKADLSKQVADLNSQIGNLETNVNQSQYDKDAAVRDMDELRTNLAAAEESNTELETQLEETKQALTTVQEEKDKLEEEVAGYRDEIAFYDDHVVFAMLNAGDKYYHRYSCSQFTKKQFVAYSIRLAESNGYTPCPECMEEPE